SFPLMPTGTRILNGTAGVPPALSVANNPLDRATPLNTTHQCTGTHCIATGLDIATVLWLLLSRCVVNGLFATLSAGGTPAVPVRTKRILTALCAQFFAHLCAQFFAQFTWCGRFSR